MSFSLRNLSVIAYANGFSLWHYRDTISDINTIVGKGFFSSAADLLAPGDMIMISSPQGSAIRVIAGSGASLELQPLL